MRYKLTVMCDCVTNKLLTSRELLEAPACVEHEAPACVEHEELLQEFIDLQRDTPLPCDKFIKLCEKACDLLGEQVWAVPDDNTAIDTPVWCKQNQGFPWMRGHFAGFSAGIPCCWYGGNTSWCGNNEKISYRWMVIANGDKVPPRNV